MSFPDLSRIIKVEVKATCRSRRLRLITLTETLIKGFFVWLRGKELRVMYLSLRPQHSGPPVFVHTR